MANHILSLLMFKRLYEQQDESLRAKIKQTVQGFHTLEYPQVCGSKKTNLELVAYIYLIQKGYYVRNLCKRCYFVDCNLEVYNLYLRH